MSQLPLFRHGVDNPGRGAGLLGRGGEERELEASRGETRRAGEIETRTVRASADRGTD